VTSGNGPVTLQATGGVTVGSGLTINSGTAVLSLAADVNADGAGDDGTGTLSVGARVGLYGASIALRGADVSIDSTANVGSAANQPPNSNFVSAGLNTPLGLAFDSSGNLYVANYKGNTISKVTPDGTVSTLIDASGGLSEPVGLTFDSSGALYISNGDNSTITKLTAAIAATTQVTIQSSLPILPISLGSTSSGTGINLTSAELARIVTAPSGTFTIGDPTQTGDITFSGATVATTAGAATTVVQSTTGPRQIVLDDSNGTALDGNGVSISLTAGTGGI